MPCRFSPAFRIVWFRLGSLPDILPTAIPAPMLGMLDRYFFGGRLSSFRVGLTKIADGRPHEWHRFGRFRYVLPVAPDRKYKLRLYFMEHWFGVENGGIGGVGSRVFDVYCNGSTLLK